MLPSPRRRRVPLPLLGAAGIVAGLLLAALLAAPRVEAVSPAPGAGAMPASAPIQVAFSAPMDESSVEARFSTNPAVAGELRWEGTSLTFMPAAPWPQLSTVTVRLAAGARSRRWLPLLSGREWSFSIGAPRLLYLSSTDGRADLYLRGLDEEAPTRLTETASGVMDYSVAPGGISVVYTAEREDSGTDLRQLELATAADSLLYACPPGSRCQAPAESPGGDWLAFELYELEPGPGEEAVTGPGRVWALRAGEAQAAPVGPEDHVSTQPFWSPSGALAYYDNTLGAFALVDAPFQPDAPVTGYVPNTLGAPGAWSPDGAFLLLPEITIIASGAAVEDGEEGLSPFFSHLYRIEADSGVSTDLSGQVAVLVEDASPAYSPDGRWIAFARKYLDPARWTPGRQLWVMRADGSDARPLTNDPDFNHSAITWNPDSKSLLFMRFNQIEFSQPAEIWWADPETGATRRLVSGGYLPAWIP